MARRKRKTDSEETTYWLSYSDMMAALLLVFILIISLTMLHSQKQYEEKQAQLEEQQLQLEEQKKTIEQAVIDAKKAQEEAEKQQATIEEQQRKLDLIVGVKGEIISDLQKEFENSSVEIRIDPETGAITFDSDLLFDPDRAVLRQTSKAFLDEFLPRYFTILLDEKYINNISEIIIEGHTARYGTYMKSLTLSQDRAFAVAQYALRDGSQLYKLTDKDTLRNIITVNGRAYYDPIYFDDGTVDDNSSRRVEIKFRLKNEEMVEEMLDILTE